MTKDDPAREAESNMAAAAKALGVFAQTYLSAFEREVMKVGEAIREAVRHDAD